MRRDARIDALARVPLLSGLSKAELGRVLNLGDEVEFFPGKIIVEAGDLARDFYMVLSGTARLTVAGKKSETLEAGDYFGEMAVLDGGPRTATIVALTHVTALRIDRKDFLSLLKVNGSISRKILVEMTKRIRASEAAANRH
jgi:CRP/FNR family transcriptional regulator, cyclic AMP receptor protein